MKTSKKTVQNYPLGYTDYEDIRTEAFGAVGTVERSQYELELRADLLAERIKQLRKRAKLTQTQLGNESGCKKRKSPSLRRTPLVYRSAPCSSCCTRCTPRSP